MATKYYLDSKPEPPLLLRRVDQPGGYVDESYLHGEWTATPLIVDYEFGQNNWIDPVSEAQARKTVPAAF